jgi:hypothetical protein
LDFARKVFPGLRSIVGHNLIDPLQLSVAKPFFMTMLREPIARVISHYQDSVLRGNNQVSFEETLRRSENLKNLQTQLIGGESNLDKAKRALERCAFVGLTEKFDLSLRVLNGLSPWKLNLDYGRKIVARNNKVKEAIERDSRMLELAREYNKLDLALYRFAVDEIFPRLCEKACVNPADKNPSYQSYTHEALLKFQLGRLYNRLYRQLCKVHYRNDPRPLLGNTAQDVFAPLLEKLPNRS